MYGVPLEDVVLLQPRPAQWVAELCPPSRPRMWLTFFRIGTCQNKTRKGKQYLVTAYNLIPVQCHQYCNHHIATKYLQLTLDSSGFCCHSAAALSWLHIIPTNPIFAGLPVRKMFMRGSTLCPTHSQHCTCNPVISSCMLDAHIIGH